MKTKFIVAWAVGILGIASIVLGTTTFAANETPKQVMGQKIQAKVMFNKDKQETMLKHFTTPEQAEAFRAEVQKTRDAKDYVAFKKIHEKYGITNYASEEQFQAMLQRRTDAQMRKAARGIEGKWNWMKGEWRGMGICNK